MFGCLGGSSELNRLTTLFSLRFSCPTKLDRSSIVCAPTTFNALFCLRLDFAAEFSPSIQLDSRLARARNGESPLPNANTLQTIAPRRPSNPIVVRLSVCSVVGRSDSASLLWRSFSFEPERNVSLISIVSFVEKLRFTDGIETLKPTLDAVG